MIVVDVNIALYFLVEGQRTSVARKVFERDAEWLAPSLLPHEFLNVLATWHKKGLMTDLQCHDAWNSARMMFDARLVEPDWNETLRLALKHRITAYDAQYVSLALARRLPLVTEDGELLRKFPEVAASMAGFIDSVN